MRFHVRGALLVAAAVGIVAITALAVALVWRVPVAATRQVSIPELLLRVKPAVVLVVAEVTGDVRVDCGDGETRVNLTPFRETGSGWIIDAAGWVLTNAHVVQIAHSRPDSLTSSLTRKAAETTCLPRALERKGLAPGARPDVEEQLRRQILTTVAPRARAGRVESALHVLLSDGTRHAAALKKYSPPAAGDAMSGRDLALLKIEAADLPVFPVGARGTPPRIGDALHIFGFPGAVSNHELLSQSTRVEASVTNGTVSGFKKDVAENPVIQTDAPASWGNSGGPAVADSGRLTGVLTFVTVEARDRVEIVQGFNFIIPADTVREFLADTGVAMDARSRFNDVWWPALAATFSGRRRAAIPHLEKAAELRPGQPDVQRLLSEARSRPRDWPWPWIGGATVLAAAALGVAIVLRRSRRRRLAISVSDLIGLLESETPPLLIDARAEGVYAKSPVRIPKAIRVEPEGPAAPRGRTPPQLAVAYATCPDVRAMIRVARQLRARGYRNLRILDGGLEAWVDAGLPVEANEGTEPAAAAHR
jgi:rhodanese-related sulfurtransferase